MIDNYNLKYHSVLYFLFYAMGEPQLEIMIAISLGINSEEVSSIIETLYKEGYVIKNENLCTLTKMGMERVLTIGFRDFDEDINNELGYLEDDDIKRKLYHYTSIDALKSILDNKKLWISKGDYLNDSTEFEYAKELIYSIVDRRNDISDAIKKQIINLVNNIENELENAFVLSMSKDSDSLILWSNYSDYRGYNIEFSNQKMIESLIEDKIVIKTKDENKSLKYNSDFYIKAGSVIYGRRKQVELINKIIERANSIHEYFYTYGKLTETYESQIIRRLAGFILFFKNPKFKDEKEYRYIFIINNNVLDNKIINHRIHKSAFIPYIEVEFVEKMPISKVIIGPGNNTDISKKGLLSYIRSCMGEKKVSSNFVSESNIPLRYDK